MDFIRWGSPSPQSFNHHWRNKPKLSFKTDDIKDFYGLFHLAPKSKGFFAFPLGFHNYDLLLGGGSVSSGRYRFLRDEKGEKIMVRPVDYYHDLDGWWIWNTEWCSCGITPYYYDLLTKMGVDPGKVLIYSETEQGGYDPHVWLHRAYWGADHEPRYDEKTHVDLDITYPLAIENKPKRFKYEGKIWHHFEKTYPYDNHYNQILQEWWNQMSEDEREGYNEDSVFSYGEYYNYLTDTELVKSQDILEKRGTWILTEMNVYQDILKKVKNIYQHDAMEWMRYKSTLDEEDDYYEEGFQFRGGFSGLPRRQFVTKDFEVFIEKLS